jgi:lipopolysaccharide export system protein LptC
MTIQADIIQSKRRALAHPGGFHDGLIRFLATALPAAVGLLAAVMILSPLAPRGEISFLLDRNKVAVAQDRLKVENATYRGKDGKGRSFEISAGSAVQVSASDSVVRMNNLAASIELADGPARFFAPDGAYDFDHDRVQVTGPVELTTAGGYRLAARGVAIDMQRRLVTGSGGIDGAVPAGTFSADGIRADLDARTVALEGNARLTMAPGRMRMP